MSKILPIFLALLSLSSLNAQLIPPAVKLSPILGPVSEALPSVLVGYGDDGVLITHSGDFLENDLLIHLESTELDIENPDEWTVSWTNSHGESYHLAYLEEDIYVIGDNNDKVLDISPDITYFAGVPEDFDYYLVSTMAKGLVDHVDEEGGDITYNLEETFAVGVDLLEKALEGIQNDNTYAQAIAVNVVSVILVTNAQNNS